MCTVSTSLPHDLVVAVAVAVAVNNVAVNVVVVVTMCRIDGFTAKQLRPRGSKDCHDCTIDLRVDDGVLPCSVDPCSS